MNAPFHLPSVDKLLQHPHTATLLSAYGKTQTTQAIRSAVAEARIQWLGSKNAAATPNAETLIAAACQALAQRFAPRLKSVFNLTGTVLHTNLGRALLPQEAIDAVAQALATPSNLEYDLATGGRGDRDDLVEDLICELTGAEAATIVNNNAAAVLLCLSTLTAGREAIVSRGELVEIGGAFRIPDIMQRAGATLVEVGTTNRTHARDYENAISDATALLMKVHCSNYAISGFTKSVSDAEVTQIAHAHQLPMMVDLGSGTLVDLRQWDLPHEVTVRETIEAGADLVTFSGDKLLGGPQAGIIVGRKALIAQIKKNPLKRALRVGKLTLAALEPTLRLYLHPEQLATRLTTLRLFTRTEQEMQAQADQLQPALQTTLGSAYQVSTAAMSSQIGSGALPVESLPSYGLMIRPTERKHSGRQLQQLETAMRSLARPIIGRLQDDALWLDLRCLEHTDQATFIAQLSALTTILSHHHERHSA
ncbi:L-seryl-tRNA(Sec) selenium transferase [Lampropedia puyangensis]|uniref:L-seryl-tRNA(Sec) selenium transferase n=1 Tax=Lampropedia puyangensis TaxID=1330072 RepID=A0A4S8FAK4_9BURK|nr:L-seryl-tRNA(Sec) selenium transferase [Lampropedia puyangensis]THU04530.1 L-seryl-tRNA(Sec) selenium transferase [Lampropedia puyangensis]